MNRNRKVSFAVSRYRSNVWKLHLCYQIHKYSAKC